MTAKDEEQRADEEERLGKYRGFNSASLLIEDLHDLYFHCCPQCGLLFYPESATDIHCKANQ